MSTQILVMGITKFATCYFFGNIFTLVSASFLVGFKNQFKSSFEKKRRYYSLIYFFSLLLVIYLTFKHFSIFLLFPCICIQFISLVMYLITYVPGGVNVLNFCNSKIGKLMLWRIKKQTANITNI